MDDQDDQNKKQQPGDNLELSSDTKKGCVGSAALLAWFFPPLWPIAIAATWAMYPKTSKKVAIVLGGSVVFILIAGIISSQTLNNQPRKEEPRNTESSTPSPDTPPSETGNDGYSSTTAEIRCRRAVKESLKDPSSLKIGWGTVVSGTYADNPSEWLVKFPFRARNSFNALTPGYAQCTVNKRTGSVTWIDVQNQ